MVRTLAVKAESRPHRGDHPASTWRTSAGFLLIRRSPTDRTQNLAARPYAQSYAHRSFSKHGEP